MVAHRMISIVDRLNRDLAVLREAIGAVGEHGDQVFRELRTFVHGLREERLGVHQENERLVLLVDSQTWLALLKIVMLFDADHNEAIDEPVGAHCHARPTAQ